MAIGERPEPGRRSLRVWLLAVATILLSLGCCVVPGFTCRSAVDVNTFYPEEGLTMDQMRAKYGPPSEAYSEPNGRATWYYYPDKLGSGSTMVGVHFDADGKVESYFNH